MSGHGPVQLGVGDSTWSGHGTQAHHQGTRQRWRQGGISHQKAGVCYEVFFVVIWLMKYWMSSLSLPDLLLCKNNRSINVNSIGVGIFIVLFSFCRWSRVTTVGWRTWQ